MSKALGIVLAAGKGTRMESDLPKVLVSACGRPLVDYVLDAIEGAGVDKMVVVVGYRGNDVRRALHNRTNVEFVEQTEQLGTGHAVQVCMDHLVDFDGPVVVVTGDSPLTQKESIQALLDLYFAKRPACILGTLKKDDPTGLGRIVRDMNGNFECIVEQKDASPDQLKIKEVNMSTYVFDCKHLVSSLSKLQNDNRQGEYYITDCPGILKAEGLNVQALPVLKACEALSVNNLADLSAVEDEMKRLNLVQ